MGKVAIIGGTDTTSGADTTVALNGNNGDVITGDNGQNGAVIIKNHSGKEIIHLGHFQISLPKNIVGQQVRIELNSDAGQLRIRLNENGEVLIGGSGADGSIALKNDKGTERIQMDGGQGSVRVTSGALVTVYELNGNTGEIILQGVKAPGHGSPRIRFQPEGANILLGGSERAGHLFMNNKDGKDTIHLDGGKADLHMGGNQQAGNLFVNNEDGQPAVHLTGNGRIELKNAAGVRRIHIDGPGGNLWLGGQGEPGDLMLFKKEESAINDFTKATLWLSGQNGDIVLKNADCAEEFDVSEGEAIEPGTVMVLDKEGKLQQSMEAYDRKVAGVVSGAGDLRPGIVLDKKHSENRMPLALVGKVYCRVDAQYSSIEVGDLLTTSATPGYAMKAADPLRAFGAVIGKALRPLSDGCGLIPILIALQ